MHQITGRYYFMTNTSSGTGLKENVAALLCYVLTWVTGIIFLLIESKNKTIKFHALQSIVVFGALSIVSIVIGWIPFIGWIISWLCGVVGFILWIVLMVKAYQGGTYHLPVAGQIADRWV
jgi:uncharacterized membrane protein